MEQVLGIVLRGLVTLIVGLVAAAVVTAGLGLILWASWNNSIALFPNVPEIGWIQSIWFLVLGTTLRVMVGSNPVPGSKKSQN